MHHSCLALLLSVPVFCPLFRWHFQFFFKLLYSKYAASNCTASVVEWSLSASPTGEGDQPTSIHVIIMAPSAAPSSTEPVTSPRLLQSSVTLQMATATLCQRAVGAEKGAKLLPAKLMTGKYQTPKRRHALIFPRG